MFDPISIPDDLKLVIQLESIFTPYEREKRDSIVGTPHRFVHYTSAEAALNIIRTKQIWMRNTTCMSDYREVQHGFEILEKVFFNDSTLKAFTDALDTCSPNCAKEG